MINPVRHSENPILAPNKENLWESEAVFNGSIIKEQKEFHLIYRAVGPVELENGPKIQLSSIGSTQSSDGIHFTDRFQLIKPEYDWEKFGCEDPRITKINDKYFIFYTALSDYPPSAAGIKVGLAITQDLKTISQKYPVTHFNSKGMALFPQKINNRLTAILTVNTDQPPAKICLAFFDYEEQIWSKDYWNDWLRSADRFTLPLQKDINDHIEVGAPPVETRHGWLVIYCYIKNYFAPPPTFGIEAVLLDLKDPFKILGHTSEPLLVPKKDYELNGKVPQVVFPSGALIQNKKLFVYYGAADTTCCLATVNLENLLREMSFKKKFIFLENEVSDIKLEKYEQNPIIQPREGKIWEAKGTFNPAAVLEGGKIHLLYRAFSQDNVSSLGYASSTDGFQIDERSEEPVYVPRENFEKRAKEDVWSGCEDPRITKIENRFFMCYTAYDGINPTRVALTSISVDDFLHHKWEWERPILISPPGVDDKNACILPEKINGKYVIFHRIHPCIWIDFVPDLNFGENRWLKGSAWFKPRTNSWDNSKIGIGPPPLKTKKGWLLLYHGVSEEDKKYRTGVMLLDLKDPTQVLSRPDFYILESDRLYETGEKEVVFPCGAVINQEKLLVYYGAGDWVVCVASIELEKLLSALI